MLKPLTWLGSSAAASLTHGPLFAVLVIFGAVLLATVVVAFIASVFFTGPRKNLVALIRAWRHGP